MSGLLRFVTCHLNGHKENVSLDASMCRLVTFGWTNSSTLHKLRASNHCYCMTIVYCELWIVNCKLWIPISYFVFSHFPFSLLCNPLPAHLTFPFTRSRILSLALIYVNQVTLAITFNVQALINDSLTLSLSLSLSPLLSPFLTDWWRNRQLTNLTEWMWLSDSFSLFTHQCQLLASFGYRHWLWHRECNCSSVLFRWSIKEVHEKHKNTCTFTSILSSLDDQMERKMNERMNEWMDEWMKGRMELKKRNPVMRFTCIPFSSLSLSLSPFLFPFFSRSHSLAILPLSSVAYWLWINSHSYNGRSWIHFSIVFSALMMILPFEVC